MDFGLACDLVAVTRLTPQLPTALITPSLPCMLLVSRARPAPLPRLRLRPSGLPSHPPVRPLSAPPLYPLRAQRRSQCAVLPPPRPSLPSHLPAPPLSAPQLYPPRPQQRFQRAALPPPGQAYLVAHSLPSPRTNPTASLALPD